REVAAAGAGDGDDGGGLCLVDRVCCGAELEDSRLGDVVGVDGQRGVRRGSERGSAGGVTEHQVDRLVPLDQRVVDDGDDKALARLAVGEGQGSAGGDVVAAGGGG